MRMRAATIRVFCLLALVSGCSSTDSTAPLDQVASVSIVAPKSELVVGQQVQLAARPLNATGGLIAGRTAVWTSTDQGVATVSSSGVVAAIAPGSATINALSGEKTGSVTIKVVGVPIASITIAPLQSPVAAGTHVTLAATAKDSAGGTLTGRSFVWTSSDSSIARVSQDGVITGLAPGSVIITAFRDGKSGTVVVNVVAGAAATVTVSNTGKVFVQGSRQLTIIARDVLGNAIANPSVTWTSSDATSVSVSGTGVVTGLKAGSDVIITASSGSASGTTATRALAATTLGSGDAHNCLLADSGEIFCWGTNTSGELGAGPIGADTSYVPIAIAGGLRFASLSVGASHSCALTADGTAYCWGSGEQGQLGYGSKSSKNTPIAVTGGIRFSLISAGRYHTCGVALNGDFYCWGNSFGAPSPVGITPTRIDSNVRFTLISSGESQTCGLDAQGILYCWTVNGPSGGPGNIVQRTTDQRFVSVSITRGTDCALTAEGKVYCWARSAFKPQSTADPVELVTSLRFKKIATAVDRLCGITFDNAAYCIGTGGRGEIGDGAVHNTSTPDFVKVSPGISNITQFMLISAGLASTCGASLGGTPFCWGRGSMVGNGSPSNQFSPVMLAQPQ